MLFSYLSYEIIVVIVYLWVINGSSTLILISLWVYRFLSNTCVLCSFQERMQQFNCIDLGQSPTQSPVMCGSGWRWSSGQQRAFSSPDTSSTSPCGQRERMRSNSGDARLHSYSSTSPRRGSSNSEPQVGSLLC